MYTYKIIDENLKKLEKACEQSEHIYNYKNKVLSDIEKSNIKKICTKLGIIEYLNFIDWIKEIESSGFKVKYDKIDFKEFKEILIANAFDDKVKEFIKSKIKKGMDSFLKSEDFLKFSGRISHGKKGRKRYYSPNFVKSNSLICNYVIQNEIETQMVSIGFFNRALSEYESQSQIELEITREITKSLIKKIDSIKYDFRKLNIDMLRDEIDSSIRKKILSIDENEVIKCIEEKSGITINKTYKVDSYKIGENGNLMVFIKNDDDIQKLYNYRLFENINRFRDNVINCILD